MKKLFTLLTICLLFGCSAGSDKSSENSKESEKKPKNNIVGSWDIFEDEDLMETSLTFYNDGTGILIDNGPNEPGMNRELFNYHILGDSTILCLSQALRDFRDSEWFEDDVCGTVEWVSDDWLRFDIIEVVDYNKEGQPVNTLKRKGSYQD